jgi:hypothetical protein
MGTQTVLYILTAIVTIILLIAVFSWYIRHLKKKFVESVKVWLDHLLYTRMVILAIINKSNNLPALLSRLEKNQGEIAKILQEPSLKKLLLEHITLAGKLFNDTVDKKLALVIAGDKDSLYKNAQVIGETLDKKYKTHLFTKHMKHHIDTLVAMLANMIANNTNSSGSPTGTTGTPTEQSGPSGPVGPSETDIPNDPDNTNNMYGVNDMNATDNYMHSGMDMAFDLVDAAR